jgi:hypothetical protein
VNVIDLAGNIFNTQIGEGNRTITEDTTVPVLSYVYPTPNKMARLEVNGLLKINVSATNTNNITFYLYNSAKTLVNSASLTSSGEIDFNLASGGLYYYNVSAVSPLRGNTVWLATRNVTAIKSCLDLTATSCVEESNCEIGEPCYLYSDVCTNSVCDFVNFTMNESGILYTMTNGGDNGRNLNIHTSDSQTFALGSRIVFSGANGSEFSPGTVGGNASTINWTADDLFNTRYIVFEGIGGSSTLAGANGGNGGRLRLSYRGLILNFNDNTSRTCGNDPENLELCPDNTPILFGGLNLSGTKTGIDGSIDYRKSIVCISLGNNRTGKDVDINNDGFIDDIDINLIEVNYAAQNGTNGDYNETYDINCDNRLDIIEIGRQGLEYNSRSL